MLPLILGVVAFVFRTSCKKFVFQQLQTKKILSKKFPFISTPASQSKQPNKRTPSTVVHEEDAATVTLHQSNPNSCVLNPTPTPHSPHEIPLTTHSSINNNQQVVILLQLLLPRQLRSAQSHKPTHTHTRT